MSRPSEYVKEDDMRVLYFAYGSNMNPARMRARCPSARRVGTATLRGWRLVERLYADVERSPGSAVRGVLYWLTERDLSRLDRCEGWPTVYGSRRACAWVDGLGWCDCMVYVLTDKARRERDGKPYPDWYRQVCSDGARANGIPDAFAAA